MAIRHGLEEDEGKSGWLEDLLQGPQKTGILLRKPHIDPDIVL
jgi:hypothetical protein